MQLRERRSAMINHVEDTFAMGLTSMSTLTDSEGYASMRKRIPMDAMPDMENPFVMGRTLLVLAVVELIIGLGVYRFIL
jgi:hypothetical protein